MNHNEHDEFNDEHDELNIQSTSTSNRDSNSMCTESKWKRKENDEDSLNRNRYRFLWIARFSSSSVLIVCVNFESVCEFVIAERLLMREFLRALCWIRIVDRLLQCFSIAWCFPYYEILLCCERVKNRFLCVIFPSLLFGENQWMMKKWIWWKKSGSPMIRDDVEFIELNIMF